ncbi:hypothetical protein PAXRUDRAFT_18514 [Paxillus rubicundulus Ve08.2h10]|uniref:Uncharacterized protein n=1 Tax=Paxillus rubicundulus Ve08.2h10 TaxID=930991 RepID=A0A0D0DEM6_9AGAM|nr:hypothetical protein PAXRUDRAFT_18514 [Paxillus rubicundulus Ve08.2h10]
MAPSSNGKYALPDSIPPPPILDECPPPLSMLLEGEESAEYHAPDMNNWMMPTLQGHAKWPRKDVQMPCMTQVVEREHKGANPQV